MTHIDWATFIRDYRHHSQAGLSDRHIAEQLGVSLGAVRRWIGLLRADGIDINTPSAWVATEGWDKDIESVADTAHNLCLAARVVPPWEVHAQIARACVEQPTRMAQVVMTLAMWVDPDEPMSVRAARLADVEAERGAAS